jgi:hypothetical protein
MSDYPARTRPAQFRLPAWAHEYVEERSANYGVTKTEVVLEALSLLRDTETGELMAEGYREIGTLNVELAERGAAIAAESLPEW